ncbi:MAG: response regulator [Pseudomonadota bacterium]
MYQRSEMPAFSGLPLPSSAPIRALLLDDSSFDRQRIRRMSLKIDFEMKLDEIDSLAQLDKAVADAEYDLVLIDYRLPIGDGMQALSRLDQHAGSRQLAKIMITGDAATDTVIRAMRGGCHDFLTKDTMTSADLQQAIINALIMVERQQRDFSLDQRREDLRAGLISALQDPEVLARFLSLMQAQFPGTSGLQHDTQAFLQDAEALLTASDDEDVFIFH